MMWMDVDTALSEVPVNVCQLIDDTDFKSIETAVTYNAPGMALYWHFVTTAGVETTTQVTPTTAGTYDWAHAGQGMYTIEIPASGGASINNDTEGFGYFTGVATGVLPWRGPTIGFRASGLNDKLIDSAYSSTLGLAGTGVTVGTNNDKTGYSLTQAFPANFASLVISAAGAGNANLVKFLGADPEVVDENNPQPAWLLKLGTNEEPVTGIADFLTGVTVAPGGIGVGAISGTVINQIAAAADTAVWDHDFDGVTAGAFMRGQLPKLVRSADGLTYTIYEPDGTTVLSTGSMTLLANTLGGTRTISPA